MRRLPERPNVQNCRMRLMRCLSSVPKLVCVFHLLLACIVASPSIGHGDEIDPVDRLLQLLSNGTKRKDLVVYNRVSKTGSSTWQGYIDRLARKLHYSAHHAKHPPAVDCPEELWTIDYCTHNVNASPGFEELANFTHSLTSLCKASRHLRCLVDYHFAFVNFSSIGQEQPMYINSVREPIDRIISRYYYARHEPRNLEKRLKHIEEFGALSMDECMELYHNCSCVGDCSAPAQQTCTKKRCQDLYTSFNSQMMFFCPWGSPACKHKDEAALQESLHTLQQYDAVVVLEHIPQSQELLEAVLPSFFQGISSIDPPKERKARPGAGVGQQKHPSESTIKALRKPNALDLAFYESAVQLLKARHAAAVVSPARDALTAALQDRRRAGKHGRVAAG